jgi:hypothetical protein
MLEDHQRLPPQPHDAAADNTKHTCVLMYDEKFHSLLFKLLLITAQSGFLKYKLQAYMSCSISGNE